MLHVADLDRFADLRTYVRGDCNSDGESRGLADAVFLLNCRYLGGEEPACLRACDANADSRLGVADAIALLGYFYLGAAPPPAPFPACDSDVELRSDALTCEQESACAS